MPDRRQSRCARTGKKASASVEVSVEAKRRLAQLEVQLGFYLTQEAMEHSELTRAAYYLSVAVQIADASPVGWYMTAEIRARLNARQQALAVLRRAVDVGFRDLAAIEANPAFRRLRTDPEYAAIVSILTTAGDTLDLLTVDRPPLPLR